MRTDISLVFNTALVGKPHSITAHFPTLSVPATGTQRFNYFSSFLCWLKVVFFINLGKQNAKLGVGGGLCFSESENLIFVALVIVWRILRQQPVFPSLPPLHPHPQLNQPICCFAASRNIWRNLPAVQRGSRFMTHTYPSSWKSPIWTHTHTHSQNYTFTVTHSHTHTHTCIYIYIYIHIHTPFTDTFAHSGHPISNFCSPFSSEAVVHGDSLMVINFFPQ